MGKGGYICFAIFYAGSDVGFDVDVLQFLVFYLLFGYFVVVHFGSFV